MKNEIIEIDFFSNHPELDWIKGYSYLLKHKKLPDGSEVLETHDYLKYVAYRWLGEFGCKDRQFEFYIKCKDRKKGILIDVVGFRENKLIGVECGGIGQKSKRDILKYLLEERQIFRLYHLPYGNTIPTIYGTEDDLCPYCGRILPPVPKNYPEL